MSYAASHRSNSEIPAGVNARRDYNAEGRRLVEALGLQVGGNYNAMDAIWKESSTGGKIYVGNETAARGPASTLAEHGITHVVNCTDDMANFCEGALLHAAEPVVVVPLKTPFFARHPAHRNPPAAHNLHASLPCTTSHVPAQARRASPTYASTWPTGSRQESCRPGVHHRSS